MRPILEKKGILGESDAPGRRPGDVTIPLWCEGKGLCIDVAVTCPHSSGNLSRDSPNEYFADQLKHRKYDSSFVGTNYDFSALVLESTGSANREGREILAQLFRFAARFSGSPFSVYAGRAWARLSCTLHLETVSPSYSLHSFPTLLSLNKMNKINKEQQQNNNSSNNDNNKNSNNVN